MVKRTFNMTDGEPEQKKFDMPSEKEHVFQVVDIYDSMNPVGKMVLDDNTVCVKCEVAIGDESGRSLLQRVSLDEKYKGFFATRLFLKAIGEQYKGNSVEIDTDNWVGKQFYATVVHNTGKNGGTFANIAEYNFDKSAVAAEKPVNKPEDIAWEE